MKKMFIFVTALLCCALVSQPASALGTSPAAPAQTDLTDPKELAAFIDDLITAEMESHMFPGAAIAVVKDGQVFFQKGYGYADLENQIPVDPATTIFRIGSGTKLMTWTAVMQLAEQGKIDLDEDINTYLDFNIPDTFPEPITMKHLMSHTAGFEDGSDGHFKTRAEDVTPLGDYLKNHMRARVFPPGKVAAYSNYGASLAGYIVERVSGMPFSEYVEKNIFSSLDMTSSTLRQPLPANLAPDLASGYHFEQGQYDKAGFEFAVDYPSASMSTTAADMARFMLAHLQNGRLGNTRILSEQTTRQMHSQLFTHDPRIPGMAYGFFEYRINGFRILAHGGNTKFYNSGLWLIPDLNIGVFVVNNASGGATIGTTLIYYLMEHYFPVDPSPAPGPSVDFAARMKPYLGTYYSARHNFTTFEKLIDGLPPCTLSLDAQGNLIFTSQGQQTRLVEEAPGLFYIPEDADSQVLLKTDEKGQAFLVTNEPWNYMKVPWYGTTGFRDLVVQLGLLLFLGTSIGWGIAALVGLGKRQPRVIYTNLARWVGALFGLVLLVFFLGLTSLMAAKDPIFHYPIVLINRPPQFNLIMALPYLLAVLGLLMLVFALRAWIWRSWNWVIRLHYSLLTFAGFVVLWVLWYWNLLL